MKTKASVKVMNSYDYSHFEVSLSTDDLVDADSVNVMRKRAQRLVDEAIRQYKVAKDKAQKRVSLETRKTECYKLVEQALEQIRGGQK